MNKTRGFWLGVILSCAWGMPMMAQAQENSAIVSPEVGATAPEHDASAEMMQLANMGIATESVPSSAETQGQTEPEKPTMSQQMLAFFDGMIAAVDAKSGDCQAMSDALQKYYHEHHAWISSLDYATGNLDAETLAAIHEKAASFGKKLSVCYDQKSIPAQLHRYAGMGEVFE